MKSKIFSKPQFVLIAVVMLIAMLSSCTTSQTIKVEAPIGTSIYTPSYELLATAKTPITEVKLPSKDYYAFLLANSPNSKDFVPFALDYKHKSYALTKLAAGTGYVLFCAGLGLAFSGGIAAFAEGFDGDTGLAGIGLGAGAGALALGGALGGTAHARLNQAQQNYQFKYLSHQRTNQDITFTYPEVIEETKVTALNKPAATSTATADEGNTVRHKPTTEKSRKTFKNTAAKAEGTYTGNGQLLKGKESIETYAGIKVVIKKKDDKTVTVDVVETNGESFFNAPSEYTLTKSTGNKLVFQNANISTATITIENGKLTFSNPRVNIDGDVYTLNITSK